PGAKPGAWAWTNLPGGVPDADDTAGAVMALMALAPLNTTNERLHGLVWLGGLQNWDGGIPTFCRGWGGLPFDRSGSDLTAHGLRAWQAVYGESARTMARGGLVHGQAVDS